MKILDPQSATLTNAEVLAHFTLNPPRRSPTAPPNANPRIFVPSPDLRDHNTVVKEFQDYVSRISPHLMQYPSFYPKAGTSTSAATSKTASVAGSQTQISTTSSDETPLDTALRELITRLKPYQLTKAEVLTMINLGIGLGSGVAAQEQEQEQEQGEEGEGGGAQEDTVMQDAGAEGAEGQEEGGGEGEVAEEDYGAMAILNTVIEDRVERLTDEDIVEILAILRETLGGRKNGVVDGGAES